MTDPRLTPDPARITEETPAQVVTAVCDLCRSREGPRDRQLLFGETVTVLDSAEGWHYVQAAKDGYCGYIKSQMLGIPQKVTHRVSAPATHAYEKADIKSPDLISLSFGSLLRVTATAGDMAQTNAGFVPLKHLTPQDTPASDPVAIAAIFLGTPYLWGGNSRWGIDCSGLIQVSLRTCGISCPGDSDMQITLGHAAEGPCKRNDLLFWKGHVAIAIDGDTILHANAHSMSVAYESRADAITRIAAQGGGPVTAHRRL